MVALDPKKESQDSNLPLEVIYNENGNSLRILANVLDCNDELLQKANFKVEVATPPDSTSKVSHAV